MRNDQVRSGGSCSSRGRCLARNKLSVMENKRFKMESLELLLASILGGVYSVAEGKDLDSVGR